MLKYKPFMSRNSKSNMWNLLTLVLLPALVAGHGKLMQPPSRASMWRLGFDNPANYNDNENYCGGFAYQWQQMGGKCGVCGDKFDGPWPHEAGGKYANGLIGARFEPGQTITVNLDISAMHWGWYEFRLCPNNDPTKRVTHACLDQYVLEVPGHGTRYQIPRGTGPGIYDIEVKLPAGLTCSQCVLQWKYNTGNSWGRDPDTGRECMGCGPQEQFYGCSDIAIGDDVLPTATTPPEPTGEPSATPSAGPTDSTLPPVPTTTPPAPTPSPWPTFIPGVDCVAIGDWAGSPGMDEWCESNCAHVPPNCPADKCRCERT